MAQWRRWGGTSSHLGVSEGLRFTDSLHPRHGGCCQCTFASAPHRFSRSRASHSRKCRRLSLKRRPRRKHLPLHHKPQFQLLHRNRRPADQPHPPLALRLQHRERPLQIRTRPPQLPRRRRSASRLPPSPWRLRRSHRTTRSSRTQKKGAHPSSIPASRTTSSARATAE